jgi:hypothetical protein
MNFLSHYYASVAEDFSGLGPGLTLPAEWIRREIVPIAVPASLESTEMISLLGAPLFLAGR